MIKNINIPKSKTTYKLIVENGLLSNINKYIMNKKELAIITDDGIPSIYIEKIKNQLPNALLITIKQGEKSKTIETANFIWNKLVENGLTKSSTLISLGGGMIGDLTGFCASLYMRGVDYIQIPTTLLAQIDASVGGKTAVNLPTMKNAVGIITQPSLVLIDPLVLQTLPMRQINNGLAEMIKYGLIADKSIFYTLLNTPQMPSLLPLIKKTIKIKANIIMKDENDKGIRQILNFGHTIGHALEQYSHYDLLHGEAVAIGMLLISKGKPYYDDLKSLLTKYSLPTTYNYDKEAIIKLIQTDKKTKASKLNIILVDQVGKGYIKTIDTNEIINFL